MRAVSFVRSHLILSCEHENEGALKVVCDHLSLPQTNMMTKKKTGSPIDRIMFAVGRRTGTEYQGCTPHRPSWTLSVHLCGTTQRSGGYVFELAITAAFGFRFHGLPRVINACNERLCRPRPSLAPELIADWP